MRRTQRPKAIYQRGDFRLYRRPDRANLEIVWYDTDIRRERSASAGTSDDGQARLEVDRRYLAASGSPICSGCGRPFDGNTAPLLTRAITDYLLLGEDKKGFKATRGRLSLAVEYIAATDLTVTVAAIDERWVEGFRKWLAARPIIAPKSGVTRERSLGHIEGCVRQLAAAISATPGQKARFKAEQTRNVSASPRYRADVSMLAAMFRYCVDPSGPKVRSPKERDVYIAYRANLLRYLRAAVATWARPEEIADLRADQWIASAGAVDLNPRGRRQTRKYRGVIPVPRQFAPFLADTRGNYMPIANIRGAWDTMRAEVGLPIERGEAGWKLIRRSMATLARRRIGEANWRQGEMTLGHVRASTSDIYALRDPANLGLALAATESIIDEICALVPGAFTAPTPRTARP
jgi:hypothetical protein